MEKLPASMGWLWVKQGFALFKRQPAALLALLFSCMFLSMACLVIPLLGPLLPTLFAPMFSMALLQGCAEIDQGKRPMPGLVFIGFRKPARTSLMGVGALYNLVWLFALLMLTWIDDGVFIQMMTRQIPMDEKLLEGSRTAILSAVGLYMFTWMVTSYAAPLIYWQRQSLGKALFFSVFAVLRSFWAFVVAGVALFAIFQVAVTLPVLLFESVALEATMIFFIMFLLMIAVHCMLYVSYCRIFGAPQPVVPAQAGT